MGPPPIFLIYVHGFILETPLSVIYYAIFSPLLS